MKLLLENWREYLNENANMSSVRDAFANTPSDYLEASVKQRNPGPGSAGSTFSSPISVEELVSASWEPYNHPDIESPAIAFKAPISGQLGIADIDSLPDDQPVRFQPAHAGKATVKDEDSPDFGQQTAEVAASIPEGNRTVQHTTLILGPSQEDASKLRVWTFFPGDPTGKFPDITMNRVRGEFNTEDEVVAGTVFDAKKMGYKFVKHIEGVE
jgi:hypothetical protein